MRHQICAAALLAFAACTNRVPPDEASHFFQKVVPIAEQNPPPELKARLLLELCAEHKTCASGCAKELSGAAGLEDVHMRGRVMASCFGEFEKAHKANGIGVDEWFAGYFARYASRAREAMSEADRKIFDNSFPRLKLPQTAS